MSHQGEILQSRDMGMYVPMRSTVVNTNTRSAPFDILHANAVDQTLNAWISYVAQDTAGEGIDICKPDSLRLYCESAGWMLTILILMVC